MMVPGKDEDIHPSMGASQPYPLTNTLIDKLQNYYGILPLEVIVEIWRE